VRKVVFLVGLAVVTLSRLSDIAMASWVAPDKLTASDGMQYDRFGTSISVSGEVCIVGAPDHDPNGERSGSAYIFQFIDSNWVQQEKLVPSDNSSYDYFGESVFIDGNRCIVGAPGDDDNGNGAGSAYVFSFDGNNWIEEDKLLASDEIIGHGFGESVSLSGDTCIVAAENGACIFRLVGSNWIEEEILTMSDRIGGYYELSVSVSGSVCVVGNDEDDNEIGSGSAYIFRFDDPNWILEQKLFASDRTSNDCFGNSVSIDGDVCIIGAWRQNAGFGSAYVFHFDGSSWIEKAKLAAADVIWEGSFGCSVSIRGDVCIVGAYQDDDNGERSGSAHIFRFTGSEWIHENKLLPANGSENDLFGWSVCADTDIVAVGARGYNNSMGAVYPFRPCPAADLSGDCFVGLADFGIFAKYWLTHSEIPPLLPNPDVALGIDNTWMYQNLPASTASNLTANLSIVNDPENNTSYTYDWEFILPDDVGTAPTTVNGGGPADPCCTFAAPNCNEPNGLSDSGQALTVKVTVTGNNCGNTATAEAQFGIALLGDVNNDTYVDVDDRGIINDFWQTGSAGDFTLRDCDLNCDGYVNVADRGIVNAIWQGELGQNSVTSLCPYR